LYGFLEALMKIKVFSLGILLLLCAGANAAKITSVRGSPEIFRASGGSWEKAARSAPVGKSDKIRCDRASSVVINTETGHKIQIWPGSEVSIDEVDSAESRFSLAFGRIRSWVKKLKRNEKYEVRTPVAVCSVRGTDFDVELTPDNKTRVQVYDGVVAAREEMTGREVTLNPGEFTQIIENEPPSQPAAIPQEGGTLREPTEAERSRQEARREIFEEISREEVLAKAADEIKLAEYQNGKALIDASGKRVRLEEYIIRTQPNEFKYVVLNTRGQTDLNFGKMIFTFNDTLPQDLTLATGSMFQKEGSVKPGLWLTDVISVMSNTVDQVNEEASGGKMFADSQANPRKWTLFFDHYDFYVNNKKWWGYKDLNANGTLDANEISYYNIATGAAIDLGVDFQYDASAGRYYLSDSAGDKVYFNEFSQPDGETSFHFRQKNNYTLDQWISADDYVISDEGSVLALSGLRNKSSADLKNIVYGSNFERVYASSVFEGRKIDLVFSAKLLIDSGILSLPDFKKGL
jgi:hypothetical protein